MMSATVDLGDDPHVIRRRELFVWPNLFPPSPLTSRLALTADGQRFIGLRLVPPDPSPPADVSEAEADYRLMMVENWFTELRERLRN